ncbi:hypothetical protein BKA62DRAFT_622713 [Auriculariales sp. MPI-PUGE-AT-0066]|jgi:hypothetical protein|nr:hypothetical protein BKA62DRAFT_622713 [Auriculariales sp. MPI-PUGE-AT-0066]
MSAATESAPAPSISSPELRSLQRVGSIPLVNDTLSTLHSMLAQNTYTAWPYAQAQSISTSAYSIAAPRLQGIDGLANKGLDFVEGRYPYPFQTPTNQMYDDIQKSRAQIYDAASKTYDARVRAPVAGLAHGADQTITPFVNVLQGAYERLNTMSGNHEPVENAPNSADETQVHRALRLAHGMKDQVVVLSAEQLRQMQAQSVIVQRLTNDLTNLNALASSSVSAVKDATNNGVARAGAIAESTRAELERLSATLRAMPASLQQTLAPTIAPLQTHVTEVQKRLAEVYQEQGVPASDRASKALSIIREQFQPLSEQAMKVAMDSINGVASYLRHAVEHSPATNEKKENGDAPTTKQ